MCTVRRMLQARRMLVILESRVARCVHCEEDVASKEDVGDTGESGGKMCAL